MPRIYRIVKSPCCTPETNIILNVNSTSIKIFLIKKYLKNRVSSKLKTLNVSYIRKEYKIMGAMDDVPGKKAEITETNFCFKEIKNN